MGTTTDTTKLSRSEADALRALAQEANSLMVLGYSLRTQVAAALVRLEEAASPRTLRRQALAYLAATSSRQLRRDLIEARGAQSACVFATKLGGDLVALGKARPVLSRNGNGTHYAA
jgi:hypothetical protein